MRLNWTMWKKENPKIKKKGGNLNKAEIVRNFREAKDKAKQIKIMADLNECGVSDIKAVLLEAGFPEEELRLRKARAVPAPAKPPKNQSRLSSAMACLRDEAERLKKREAEIPGIIAALQAEFDSIAAKRAAIEKATAVLHDAFSDKE